MKFLKKMIVLPEPSNNSEAAREEAIKLLKEMRDRVIQLEKGICGETLEEAVENGSIKGKKAREIRERLDIIEGL